MTLNVPSPEPPDVESLSIVSFLQCLLFLHCQTCRTALELGQFHMESRLLSPQHLLPSSAVGTHLELWPHMMVVKMIYIYIYINSCIYTYAICNISKLTGRICQPALSPPTVWRSHMKGPWENSNLGATHTVGTSPPVGLPSPLLGRPP